MKKFLKYSSITLVVLVIILFCAARIFKYKVDYGIAKDQTEKHHINFPSNQVKVALFSKTTGFRHGEAIDASKPMFFSLATKNNWFLYETEDAGFINEEELSQFDVVIWNNSTGKCLTDDQRVLLENYIKNGGTYIGLHGSGDFSHHWEWYRNDLIGAVFSHHPIKNQIQEATARLNNNADSTLLFNLSGNWDHSEEWYVFYDHPEKNGFEVLYSIDGTQIDPNGNIPILESGKNFGMGENHPIAWYKEVIKGKTFYTSIGHQGVAYRDPNLIQMLENAIKWGLKD